MTDRLDLVGGAVLMLAGTAALVYAVYLEMLRAVPLRWWDRTVLLVPAGLAAILTGVLLTR